MSKSQLDHSEGDYFRAVGVIQLARTLRRWARVVFLFPVLLLVACWARGMSEKWLVMIAGLVWIPAILIYSKLRYPTLRLSWADDFRGPLVVLRSFTDERLKAGETIYPDDFVPGAAAPDNFIWHAAISIWDIARVVVLQREENTISPVFSIAVESTEQVWRDDVKRATIGAWAILLFPSPTSGVIEEIAHLKAEGLLWKTVVFMPPSPAESDWLWARLGGRGEPVDWASRWNEVRDQMLAKDVVLPPHDSRGKFFVPDDQFSGVSREIVLHGRVDFRKIADLVDPSTGSPKALIDCIPVERSREV